MILFLVSNISRRAKVKDIEKKKPQFAGLSVIREPLMLVLCLIVGTV
jgi:hypothetical protein